MNPWTLPNLNGRKPLPASGPFWASAASMNETGLGRPNAAPAHAAVNRALRRVRFNIAISLLCLRRRPLQFACRSRRVVSGVRKHLLGNFGILALRPQVRRVADKVEQMRKCVLTVQDALDIEKDEPFDSSGPRRLRNVPADPGSTDDVQHPAASEVDEEKPGARVHFQMAECVEEQVAAEIRKAKLGS